MHQIKKDRALRDKRLGTLPIVEEVRSDCSDDYTGWPEPWELKAYTGCEVPLLHWPVYNCTNSTFGNVEPMIPRPRLLLIS